MLHRVHFYAVSDLSNLFFWEKLLKVLIAYCWGTRCINGSSIWWHRYFWKDRFLIMRKSDKLRNLSVWIMWLLPTKCALDTIIDYLNRILQERMRCLSLLNQHRVVRTAFCIKIVHYCCRLVTTSFLGLSKKWSLKILVFRILMIWPKILTAGHFWRLIQTAWFFLELPFQFVKKFLIFIWIFCFGWFWWLCVNHFMIQIW